MTLFVDKINEFCIEIIEKHWNKNEQTKWKYIANKYLNKY